MPPTLSGLPGRGPPPAPRFDRPGGTIAIAAPQNDGDKPAADLGYAAPLRQVFHGHETRVASDMAMWVVLLVSIHLLLGPNVTVVSDFGPYRSRNACEQDLEKVRLALPDEDRDAIRSGELALLCIGVSDYRGLADPVDGSG
jgi:hypothetical protein